VTSCPPSVTTMGVPPAPAPWTAPAAWSGLVVDDVPALVALASMAPHAPSCSADRFVGFLPLAIMTTDSSSGQLASNTCAQVNSGADRRMGASHLLVRGVKRGD
jgi:hypothetical protein